MSCAAARRQILNELSARIRQMKVAGEGSGSTDPGNTALFSTGIPGLDRWLPRTGRDGGMLFEFLAEGAATGAAELAFQIAARAVAHGGALVVLDRHHEFYPPAAAALGIDLRRAIVVRPQSAADAAWAFEQALRCAGVAAAWCANERWNDHVFRRLRRAAETGNALGLILTPCAARAVPSWADLRLLVRPQPAAPATPGRRLQIELLHARGGVAGDVLELEISDETGHVHLASPVAAAVAAGRAARA